MDKIQVKNRQLSTFIIFTAFLVVLATGFLTGAFAEQSTKNVKVQHVSEQDFNTVRLHQDAIQRLGVKIAPAKLEAVKVTKSYGGEVIVPLGKNMQMLAPVAGKLIVPNQKGFQVGMKVKRNQLLYQIQPVLSADAQTSLQNSLTDAKGAVETAETQLSAAKVRLERAQKLLKNLVGSQKSVDDATESYGVAQSTLSTAQLRYQALEQSARNGASQLISVTLPQGGEISNILAMPNQLVAAGSPIIEFAQLDSLWVKVPIPLSDVEQIDPLAPAMLQAMSANVTSSIKAEPVIAPPSADPLTGATYRYYAFQNKNRSFNPAQRVLATLNTKGVVGEALTVPWSAVVFDIYGGSWIYVQKGEGIFERQRVFVERVISDKAVLSHGLEEGTSVVSQGALELLGVETGISH